VQVRVLGRIPRADTEVAGGDPLLLRRRVRTLARQFVPCKLLTQELVVRFVFVERGDYVISIAPRRRPKFVALEAHAVRIADNVEPVPGPMLAVMMAGEEAVHQALIRTGSRVIKERTNLFRRRWQPREAKRQTANQSLLIRRWTWLQTC